MTQGMCIEVVQVEPNFSECITDHFKTQEMCDNTVCNIPCMLLFVPDRLKTQ